MSLPNMDSDSMIPLYEINRLKIQIELDAQKSCKERNILGQFATPSILADQIIRYALTLFDEKTKITFLDPAVGTGSFISALFRNSKPTQINKVMGFEIDAHYAIPAQSLWKPLGVDIQNADFIYQKPCEVNLLVSNPPYVRHHHIDSTEKMHLKEEVRRRTGIEFNGLSGLYCYFIGLCHSWLQNEAISVWLIPSEFLEVNYGKSLKEYLLKKVTLLSIHRFDPNDVQFDDALVSSVVVCFRNTPPSEENKVVFSYGGDLEKPKKSQIIKISTLSSQDKWNLLKTDNNLVSQSITLGDLFIIRRGIATGDNRFFIISKEKARQLGIANKFLTPILPSPRFLDKAIIFADNEGNPEIDDGLFLIDCDLNEDELKKENPELYRYFQSVKEELSTKYLCSRRSPWYKQEKREPAAFLCSYFGRANVGSKKPFKFILNYSKAIATNGYLMMYPKKEFKEMFVSEENQIIVHEFLSNIDANDLILGGRVYGGGLLKLEPKELSTIGADRLAKEFNIKILKQNTLF